MPGCRSASSHDLAVGVHPEGADVWALGSALGRLVTVGAPPDAFNQQGQDWSQPPWRPDRLAELGYCAVSRHATDDPATCWRTAGGPYHRTVPAVVGAQWQRDRQEGTYVRYDHEALIGILALEAYRAGAFVSRRGPGDGRAMGS